MRLGGDSVRRPSFKDHDMSNDNSLSLPELNKRY
jgi:hypothetical protein